MAINFFWHNNQRYTIAPSSHHHVTSISIHTSQGSKTYHVDIIEWRMQTQLIFFKLDGNMYKARVLLHHHATLFNNSTLIIYVFSFKQECTLNLVAPQITLPHHTHKDFATVTNLRSPLSGKISKLLVTPAQRVEKNQPLIIIESMKMENEICASEDTFIKNILIAEQDLVQSGQVLITFDPHQ